MKTLRSWTATREWARSIGATELGPERIRFGEGLYLAPVASFARPHLRVFAPLGAEIGVPAWQALAYNGLAPELALAVERDALTLQRVLAQRGLTSTLVEDALVMVGTEAQRLRTFF